MQAPTTYGSCSFSLSLGGLLLNETRYAPLTHLPLHQHDAPYLCIVLGGSYRETTTSRATEASAGALLGHPAGDRHENQFSAQGGRCLNLTPAGAWQDNTLWADWLHEYTHSKLSLQADTFMRLQREIRQADSMQPLAVAAALFDLLASAQRQTLAQATAPSWLKRVLDKLEASLSHTHSLLELASDAGVHPAHLARAFRRWRGESIGCFVRRRRLENALHQLARGSEPLSALALSAGFSDQAHLSRAVKQATGQTPGAYRTNMQSRFKNACPVQDGLISAE
ncbi:AraC family transcriptional regulator [Undibacterium sp.]|jgi:AraC family transcriptional regulator|uniref:helix-turn-helix domain-containing protein n=1 Tax=Undibacterium sp. TaxID=1914977 RepID=UPI002C8C8853|nr:AraC family transcriptional regulator [Undibacterium sp.]HTD06290.1 AraC family transcriptional regulator [Undibacterium sp.]